MRVLALASQKRWIGKTTLSGHLAVQAELNGDGPVVLIDIDPQGSLADWWNEREAELPAFAQATVARLASGFPSSARAQGSRWQSSTPRPRSRWRSKSVISVAELIVVPTRPSPHDLRAVGATVDLCGRTRRKAIDLRGERGHRAKITTEAAIALCSMARSRPPYCTTAPTLPHQLSRRQVRHGVWIVL